MKNTKVSIVIPVYNVQKYLEKCLQSIIKQTYKNIEIIVVNDGSTDKSLDILLSYKEKDPRIHLIDQSNQGLSGARNSGIDVANGEYILFVDSDDFIEPELVESCLQRIEKDKSDIVVYGYKKVKEDMTLIAQPYLANEILNKHHALEKLLRLEISPMACNKFIKTSLLRQNNIYFPLSKLHEDVGTMYKIFWHAERISTTSKSYYYWINRETSITGTITFKHINHLIELLTEKKHFLQTCLIYDTYYTSYNIGVLKLFTLILERAMNTSNSLVEYVLYMIDQEILLTHHDIQVLQNEFHDILSKFQKRLNEGRSLIENGNINKETFYKMQKENRFMKETLERMEKSIFCKLFHFYIEFRDILFPKGSTRREILKKIKGK